MEILNEKDKWENLTRIERLGEILVRFHAIKLSQLTELIENQRKNPEIKLGELAVQKGLISREDLLKFLATQIQEGKVIDQSLRELGKLSDEEKWDVLAMHERLGELLIKKKVLKLTELTKAMEELALNPEKHLGEILIERGLIKKEELKEILYWQKNIDNLVQNTIKEINH